MIEKVKIDQIRSSLDQDSVIVLIQFMGYDIDRRGKFKLRPEERTASASVDRTGRITDFGSGWRGDILDLLQEYHNMNFPKSVEYIAVCLGIYL